MPWCTKSSGQQHPIPIPTLGKWRELLAGVYHKSSTNPPCGLPSATVTPILVQAEGLLNIIKSLTSFSDHTKWYSLKSIFLFLQVDYDLYQTKADVRLERSNKNFSKKPIQQLYVCKYLNLILSLSDSIVSVHDLHTFQLVSTIQKSKGALCFSADIEVSALFTKA